MYALAESAEGNRQDKETEKVLIIEYVKPAMLFLYIHFRHFECLWTGFLVDLYSLRNDFLQRI